MTIKILNHFYIGCLLFQQRTFTWHCDIINCYLERVMKSVLHNSASVYQDPYFNLEKPVAEVKRIIESLLPAATPVFMQEGGGVINLQLLNKNEGGLSVILLLKGKINFIRKSSGGILF